MTFFDAASLYFLVSIFMFVYFPINKKFTSSLMSFNILPPLFKIIF